MGKEKILITGGLGFIFSHVAEYLNDNGYSVTVLDNLSDGSNKYLLDDSRWENIDFLQYNVNEINSLMTDEIRTDFDYIIHAAAESNVDKSISGSNIFISTNIIGTKSMLDFALKCKNLKKFIYVSTDEVYGSSNEHLMPENASMPGNPYSASKASGGHLVCAYNNTYDLPVHEIRMCNIIGRRQAGTKLIPTVIRSLSDGSDIPLYDGGLQTREYMDVRNVGPIIKYIIEKYSEVTDIFNLTFNQELSIHEVISKTFAIMSQYMPDVQYKIKNTSRKGHDMHYRMVPHPVMREFDAIGFDETIKWMLE